MTLAILRKLRRRGYARVPRFIGVDELEFELTCISGENIARRYEGDIIVLFIEGREK